MVDILTCALCQQSNLLEANNAFSTSLLALLLFQWIPLWLHFFYYINFLENCLPVLPSHLIYLEVKQFQILKYGCCPIYRMLLTLKFFCAMSTALVFCHKMLVPQCRTINSGWFDIVGGMYDFMSLVVSPLKSFVTTTLFSSDNSHLFTSFTIDFPKITVTGSFQNVMFHLMTL